MIFVLNILVLWTIWLNASLAAVATHDKQRDERRATTNTGPCRIRGDGSYILEVATFGPTFLQGGPVLLYENGTWQRLACQNITESQPNVWELDYGSLRLTIQNLQSTICLFRWTTTRSIVVGYNKGNKDPTDDDDGELGVTTFPSLFGIPIDNALDGRLSWHGSFVNAQIGTKCTTGMRGGPCVLFSTGNPTHGPTVVLSAMDHFLVTTHNTKLPTTNETVAWMASSLATLQVLPKGYSHSFVAVVGDDGITDALFRWGQFLQSHYRTQRMSDSTLTTLGYQTDNGAQYCFCPRNCDQTLLDVIQHLKNEQKVPIRYLSFQNAWWHGTRSAPWCVSDWQENPIKIPMGVAEFSRRLSMPLQLYAPYFCNDTLYAQNFSFVASSTQQPGMSSCSIVELKEKVNSCLFVS